jgi:hypothetical protein
VGVEEWVHSTTSYPLPHINLTHFPTNSKLVFQDPYETIRLLEARLAEFEGFDKKEFEYQIREEYREVQEDFRKMFEEQQTDWE